MHRFIGFAGTVLFALPAMAQLTFEDALDRARQHAPAIVAARMRIEEARSRVAGASLLLSRNPTAGVEAGPRRGERSTTDYGVEVEQQLDLPGQRSARIDAAQAFVAQEEQRARDVERQVLREVATAFLNAAEARERGDAATSGKRLAGEALGIAERRYVAGDVAQLDVNLARTAVARADAESRSATAAWHEHLSRLQSLLGSAEPVEIRGSLRDAALLDANHLLTRATERPDVRSLDAEIAEAEAEQRLARMLRWPELGVRASYSHEEGDRILLGGIALTLPLFNRGQEAAAVASARLARLSAERDALKRSIEAEVRGAIASLDALREATAEYERTVLPLVEENERLALESYEVGQIGLADLLLVRREALDARRAYIDQLLAMRLAEVELRARAGVWR
jgi:cobalt-zinc-cadmium efflux system outer membrane protein